MTDARQNPDALLARYVATKKKPAAAG